MDVKLGSSMDDVKEVVSELEEDGIKVILLMLGGQVDLDEVLVIIMNKQNVVKVNDISDMKVVVEEIIQKVIDSE